MAGGLLLSASIFLWSHGTPWLAVLVTVLGLHGIAVTALRIREVRAVPTFTPEEARELLNTGTKLDVRVRSFLERLAG